MTLELLKFGLLESAAFIELKDIIVPIKLGNRFLIIVTVNSNY